MFVSYSIIWFCGRFNLFTSLFFFSFLESVVWDESQYISISFRESSSGTERTEKPGRIVTVNQWNEWIVIPSLGNQDNSMSRHDSMMKTSFQLWLFQSRVVSPYTGVSNRLWRWPDGQINRTWIRSTCTYWSIWIILYHKHIQTCLVKYAFSNFFYIDWNSVFQV